MQELNPHNCLATEHSCLPIEHTAFQKNTAALQYNTTVLHYNIIFEQNEQGASKTVFRVEENSIVFY